MTGRMVPLPRFGARAMAIGGLTSAAVGFGTLAPDLSGHGRPYGLTVGLPGVVFRLGIGSSFTPITTCATSGIPPSLAAVTAGIPNTTCRGSGPIRLVVVLSTVAATGGGHVRAVAPGGRRRDGC